MMEQELLEATIQERIRQHCEDCQPLRKFLRDNNARRVIEAMGYVKWDREKVIKILNEFRQELQKPGAVINVDTVITLQGSFTDQLKKELEK